VRPKEGADAGARVARDDILLCEPDPPRRSRLRRDLYERAVARRSRTAGSASKLLLPVRHAGEARRGTSTASWDIGPRTIASLSAGKVARPLTRSDGGEVSNFVPKAAQGRTSGTACRRDDVPALRVEGTTLKQRCKIGSVARQAARTVSSAVVGSRILRAGPPRGRRWRKPGAADAGSTRLAAGVLQAPRCGGRRLRRTWAIGTWACIRSGPRPWARVLPWDHVQRQKGREYWRRSKTAQRLLQGLEGVMADAK